ncbi:MAG: Sapep family Mn(2+)-dependent dipeptidase [Coriobacteriales bacterium]|nr:Sapep family Mn(2+)-dependent dipeptidase [Coriobacteriales bacterium]
MQTEAQLIKQAQKYVDEVWEELVDDIDFLVQVESVEDKSHAEAGAPFGPAPREALDRALSIAERLGLEPHNCEGYVGYADLAGERETYLSTIAHSDIVPLGLDWTVDPLHVTRKEGYLLGRGVIDDKGPLVLSLYAAHFFVRKVRESGRPLPYTLRCIIGTNEETGMEDVDYYLEHFPQPAFCFTPDAVFPLICGEKGRVFAEFCSADLSGAALDGARIVSLEAGTAPNAIPGHAQAVVRAKASELPAGEGIRIEDAGVDEGGQALATLVAKGRGGHASMPEDTVNAIGLLVRYLVDNELCNEDERRFLSFEELLFADTAGQALGIAATDDIFEPLTCIGGTIHTKEAGSGHHFVQTMDIRYPKSTDGEKILGVLREQGERFGCTMSDSDDSVPFFISPDSAEIKTLLRTYNELSGRDGKAFTIGGGTYARHFERAVAFGPDDPSVPAPSWVGIEHGPDEGVSEESLRRALVIYIVALSRLMQLDYE